MKADYPRGQFNGQNISAQWRNGCSLCFEFGCIIRFLNAPFELPRGTISSLGLPWPQLYQFDNLGYQKLY